MKLYASLTSPYARKVRIVLLEKKIDHELVETDTTAADSPISSLNPLGKVPVLEQEDGSVLFDSPLIIEWLDSLGEPPLIPPTGDARWMVLRWQALADGIMDAVVTRLLELRRAPERRSPVALAHQEEKVARALNWAQACMAEDFLVQQRLTVADITLVAALEYVDFRYPHDWRDNHAKLAQWHARICEHPSFVRTRPPGLEVPPTPR